MKKIEIDDELYTYIASHTQHIGESASSILRRLLGLSDATSAHTRTESLRHVPADVQSVAVSSDTEHSTRFFDRVARQDLTSQKGVVGRFLFILTTLHRCHPEQFVRVLDIRGRNRLYFSASEAELTSTGTSTNPKQIPETPYWVVTNNNTTKKKSILTQVARELGYTAHEAEQIRDLLT
ncbi:replication initiation negative regulator SeqA [Aliidiomarina halalkaliphila]|uniref:Negative modulator of initiation of replication n=1 Tax=Aliidiomarina halalkaliphila TaxID=2593535 RepID=A0A552X4M5_9GAMM|nr:replication initiation negative regulator SeqA [Aliidiomarina halalkaliphila]TRW49972.1 replication initiation negative regulator SeqA [Aliidiomarina halalkaliphila]